MLPNWRWEALEKEEEDGLYFGRVKSPNTYDRWEYGYFTQDQLEEAVAYRVDVDINEDKPLFPDGGYQENQLTEFKLYETELEAIYEQNEGDTH